ncbi:hypothetical protein [Dyella sp. GSA-30]|uniref:hypothetical protein n=1 Tax=Dyella sp. GSA-30 TaxID=2994496 RepID=UPI00248F8FE1|nr:hypothetical protein [Dyella sp. GSA-30]BDU21600.1 hypothetical protein DYGSA30_30570 [Dyella sp. GSA-30]
MSKSDRLPFQDIEFALAKCNFNGKSRSLPFNEDVPYKTYLETAYALGIVSTRFDVRNLLCTSYVNLAATPPQLMRPGACPLYILPWNTIRRFSVLGYFQTSKPDFELKTVSCQSLIEWIIEALCGGCYVYATVNERFVPETSSHAKGVDYTHPCLLTACDSERRLLKGYTYRADGSFGAISLPFADMAAGFLLRGDRDKMLDSHFFEPALFKIALRNDSAPMGNFDARPIAEALQDYALCQAPRAWKGGEDIYGLAAVQHVVADVSESVRLSRAVDLRATRALMEHREIMRGNIRYIGDNVYVHGLSKMQSAYQAVATWAKNLHLLCYDHSLSRWNLADDRERLSQHFAEAERMSALERDTVASLIESLHQ